MQWPTNANMTMASVVGVDESNVFFKSITVVRYKIIKDEGYRLGRVIIREPKQMG